MKCSCYLRPMTMLFLPILGRHISLFSVTSKAIHKSFKCTDYWGISHAYCAMFNETC
ncbi:hypothetical protein BDB01DRAFT_781564 [Pilobolus umbonatus]|nr:hypothetical protein BDB01DRAFT_781564 [Pilobolus umbonatus]